jgi:hypothetical protein
MPICQFWLVCRCLQDTVVIMIVPCIWGNPCLCLVKVRIDCQVCLWGFMGPLSLWQQRWHRDWSAYRAKSHLQNHEADVS